MTPAHYHRDFRRLFPDLGHPGQYLDILLCQADKEAHLNTLALETAITCRHGEIPDGRSLADEVAERYGADAVAFVRKAI